MTERMTELGADGRLAVVMGDLNVGHRTLDIKNWKGNQKNAGFLPAERAYFDRWVGKPEKPRYNEGAGLGWVDVGRRFAGEVAGPYTWWSWRGRLVRQRQRVAHRLPARLAGPRGIRRSSCAVDRAATYAERWSDHAPVVVDYRL